MIPSYFRTEFLAKQDCMVYLDTKGLGNELNIMQMNLCKSFPKLKENIYLKLSILLKIYKKKKI